MQVVIVIFMTELLAAMHVAMYVTLLFTSQLRCLSTWLHNILYFTLVSFSC